MKIKLFDKTSAFSSKEKDFKISNISIEQQWTLMNVRTKDKEERYKSECDTFCRRKASGFRNN